jgi:signal transduction histidine kinase
MDIETLKKENEHLKQMNAVKSDLISISAHQLRTSLSALKWILKMFMDKDLGTLSSEQESFIKKAFASNERMIALVNDMLTLNHTEDTALTFTFRPEDIVKIIDETIFEFSGESHKKDIEIIFLKPENIPLVPCDREMIRVVFQNLVENAIKYSSSGDKVFISMRLADDTAEISVRDTGIGITETDKEKIFQKFFRAKNAEEKDQVGSGLGLYTTKNIVERHNGKLWFESTEGSGTTFYVSLPLR